MRGKCERGVCAGTCGGVGLFDSQRFGSKACFSDGGAGSQTAGVKTAQEQGKAQHNHLQKDGEEGWKQTERWL